ncbi:MAG: DUF721 domain-containing protein [Candidatus Puniceispirillum sp.]|jgi:hypothetical protein|uniref:DUF721 domain-containing protein n=1 Tax=Candidatus Puniceispirillum sp. TaxID=2026719 RepID=UPI001ECFEE52|nr:DUF721 domain-containing protein [Candidatus Puniceispirillum sp.]MBT6416774.1 DUF721 domain-containing protein [Candidatus Puniceispirillum sp.]MBT6565730.1 DUF721 domain-containing protein [Candidatus Puniceispirillum sp.]
MSETKHPHRKNRMARLSTMVENMVAPSAQARGFVISRLISHWPEIVGDVAVWCQPASLSFDRGKQNDGVLKLAITYGRGPQAQAMSAQIIDRVNAAFGYNAVSRITLVQSLSPPSKAESTTQNMASDDASASDIWSLDEKLKKVASPELRAALRRLGTPLDKS